MRTGHGRTSSTACGYAKGCPPNDSLARSALGQGVPILVVDSQAASLGLGLLVSAVTRQAATGATWNELLHTIQRLRGQTHFAWMADSAEPLAR